MDERLAMLKMIQELEFVAIDLNLFLDNTPRIRRHSGISTKSGTNCWKR